MQRQLLVRGKCCTALALRTCARGRCRPQHLNCNCPPPPPWHPLCREGLVPANKLAQVLRADPTLTLPDIDALAASGPPFALTVKVERCRAGGGRACRTARVAKAQALATLLAPYVATAGVSAQGAGAP